MVNAISYALKQIQTRRTEFGTTHRQSLGNGTGEKDNVDRTPKSRGSADPTQKSIFHRHARERRGTELDMCYRKRLKFMSPLAQKAWGQTNQLRETAGERASAGIANLKANIGHAERRCQKQAPGRLKAQS